MAKQRQTFGSLDEWLDAHAHGTLRGRGARGGMENVRRVKAREEVEKHRATLPKGPTSMGGWIPHWTRMAKPGTEPGVYRAFFQIHDRPVLYIVDQWGRESDYRIVAEHEMEADVIDDLADLLWLMKQGQRQERDTYSDGYNRDVDDYDADQWRR